MPTFDANSAAQWRSWQPEDLLNETVEVPLQTQDTGHSDAQFKAELARCVSRLSSRVLLRDWRKAKRKAVAKAMRPG